MRGTAANREVRLREIRQPGTVYEDRHVHGGRVEMFRVSRHVHGGRDEHHAHLRHALTA